MRSWIFSLFFIHARYLLHSRLLRWQFNRRSTTSDWLTLLHLNDCELPCWIGIIPGETTAYEAEDRIAATYGDTSLYALEMQRYFQSSVTHKSTSYQLSIALFSDNGVPSDDTSIVRSIILNPFVKIGESVSSPTISDVQRVLGDPTMARLASGADNFSVALFYGDGRSNVFVSDLECDKVLSNQQVGGIGLYSEIRANIAWLSDPQDWQGFNYCYNFERKLSG